MRVFRETSLASFRAWLVKLHRPGYRQLPVLLAVVLTAPTLGLGLIMDDYLQRSVLRDGAPSTLPGSLVGMFVWRNEAIQRPWWVADSYRASFWRPLAEVTHILDYRLWPSSPALMHAQSIFWYAVLVALVGALLRSLDDEPIRSSLATLIYASSSIHGDTVAWIANRNALLGGALSVACMLAFRRWRSSSSRGHLALACVLFASALLAWEGSLCVLGFLFAYVVCLEPGRRWRQRVLALLPFLAITVVWRVVYLYLGYGVSKVPMYIDPIAEPLRFLHAMLVKVPILFSALTLYIPPLAWVAVPQPAIFWSLLAVCLMTFGLVLTWSGAHRQPLTRFALLGTILSLVPLSSAPAGGRVMTLASVGSSVLVAAILVELITRRANARGKHPLATKILGATLAFVHLLVAPAALATSTKQMQLFSQSMVEDAAAAIPSADIKPSTQVVLVNAPAPDLAFYYPAIRAYRGLPNPDRIWTLSPTPGSLLVSSPDPTSLRLRIDNPWERIAPMADLLGVGVLGKERKGDLGFMRAEVLGASEQGMPNDIVFRFASPLTDSAVQVYYWHAPSRTYVALALEPGEERLIPDSVDFTDIARKMLGDELVKLLGDLHMMSGA